MNTTKSLACIAIALTAALSATACSPTDASEEAVAQAQSPASTMAPVAPTTSTEPAAPLPPPESPEQTAALALLDGYRNECPALSEALTTHFEASGEVLTCQQVQIEEDRKGQEYLQAVAAENERQVQEEERQTQAYLQAVAQENERQAQAFLRAVAQDREDARKVQEYLDAVAHANAQQEAEAHRQGDALLRQMCGNRGGRYWYYINPVRVWLNYCNQGGSGGGGGGGDLDCDDYGYEFAIDPNNDPYGLDGDGDGIACEGW